MSPARHTASLESLATAARAQLGLAGKPVNRRCGPGTRIPFLVISPWARANYVSHTYISQASVVRFIQDNWLGGERLGGGAFDATTGSLMDMLDFSQRPSPPLFLSEQTGEPVKKGTHPGSHGVGILIR